MSEVSEANSVMEQVDEQASDRRYSWHWLGKRVGATVLLVSSCVLSCWVVERVHPDPPIKLPPSSSLLVIGNGERTFTVGMVVDNETITIYDNNLAAVLIGLQGSTNQAGYIGNFSCDTNSQGIRGTLYRSGENSPMPTGIGDSSVSSKQACMTGQFTSASINPLLDSIEFITRYLL